MRFRKNLLRRRGKEISRVVEIRECAASQLERLLDLMERLYLEDGTTPFVRENHRRAIQELLEDPEAGRIYLFEDAGRPVGYLVVTWGFSLEYGGRDAFIDELYILPTHRRRGLGRLGLALAETMCRKRGVRALHLEVERQNRAAQRLYRRAGFRNHDRDLLTKWLDRRA